MDEKQAKKLAKGFLAENIELTVHHTIPPGIGIYSMDPKDVLLIRFSLFDEPHVSGSKYVIVSKQDGSVRFAGHQGE